MREWWFLVFGDDDLWPVSIEIEADFYRDGELQFSGRNGHAAADAKGASHRVAVYSEKDEGMYDAVNRGFRKASGEIFAYLNCDEQYLPGALQRVAAFLDEHQDIEVLFADAVVVNREGQYLCDRGVMTPKRIEALVCTLSIFTSSTFSRAILFRTRGIYFDPHYKAVGDAAWVLKLIKNRVSMRCLRFRATTFTDTGENLIITPAVSCEQAAFHSQAPAWAKRIAPIITLSYRLRRAFNGLYFLAQHEYSIYTLKSPSQRLTFQVKKPTFRWLGRH